MQSNTSKTVKIFFRNIDVKVLLTPINFIDFQKKICYRLTLTRILFINLLNHTVMFAMW